MFRQSHSASPEKRNGIPGGKISMRKSVAEPKDLVKNGAVEPDRREETPHKRIFMSFLCRRLPDGMAP
jgi:hypothetical protein